MKFDKKLLMKKFEEKDYPFCIDMLMENIKDTLSQEVKEKNPSFEYVNLKNLKMNCIKYLDDSKKHIAIKLYDFAYTDEYEETFVLDALLHMYEKISSNNIY